VTLAGRPEGTRLGGWLRRSRVAAGLTQEELAERSGVGERTIGDLEREAKYEMTRGRWKALRAAWPGISGGQGC
jgi:transcriptional regulator with XRE-family HTH domain